MQLRLPGAFLVAGILCASVPARSQEVDPSPSVESSPSPTPAPARESPRATIKTFLDSLTAVKEGPEGEDALQRAVACLDLSDMDPVARRERGESVAWMLLEVLDRTWRVDFEEVPDRRLGPPFRRVLERNGKQYGELVIARRPNGEWLVDAATVAALPALVTQLQEVERLEGLTGSAGLDPGLGTDRVGNGDLVLR